MVITEICKSFAKVLIEGRGAPSSISLFRIAFFIAEYTCSYMGAWDELDIIIFRISFTSLKKIAAPNVYIVYTVYKHLSRPKKEIL